MQENIYWDKKFTQETAMKVLADATNTKFPEIAAILLSRTNDIKFVFSECITKENFCHNWRAIKRWMRKNKWNDERIDYWSEIYKVFHKQIGKEVERKKEAATITELLQVSRIMRSERKSVGMTQKQLAQKTGLAQQTISYVETGTGDFSFSTFKKITDALGLELNILRGSLGSGVVWTDTSGVGISL